MLAAALLGAVPSAHPAPGVFDPAALYGVFKEYRQALKDPAADPTPYFSRKIVELWSGEPGRERDPAQRARDLKIARHRYRFGERVYGVFAHDASTTLDHTALLSIVYRSQADPEIKVLRLSYVYEDQRWRIDGILYALARDKDKQAGAGPVIDTFE